MLIAIFISYLIICCKSVLTIDISCIDEHGDFADWFYLYKLPRDNKVPKSGLQYLYLSSNNIAKGWQLSDKYIDDSTSFLHRTISPVLQNENTLFLAYNDEAPNGTVNFNDGHTKGVLAATDKSGFWLIHSVPKYPDIYNFTYPRTGIHYGQSFLCISLPGSQIDLVGIQQIFNEPNIYYSRVPDALKDNYPNVIKAINKNWRNDGPFWNIQEIISIKNISFKSFAKGRQFKKELYEDFVAPFLNVDLMVETWRDGPDNFPTNCTQKNKVFNVSSLNITDINLLFKSTKDHSKWAVTNINNNPWVCVGDINRAEHQIFRGGGTVCQQNQHLADCYRGIINSIESCPSSLFNLI